MSRKTANPSLTKIFGGYPFVFFPTFAEAVEVAKKCPDGCHVVWYFSKSLADPWRVGRQPAAVARDLADPGEYITLAWQDGQTYVSQEFIDKGTKEASKRERPEWQTTERQTIVSKPADRPEPEPEPVFSPLPPIQRTERPPKKPAGSVSIPALIANLKAAGMPAEKILEIIAESTR